MNTIEKQIELLRLCNEKEMDFQFNGELIYVNKFNFRTQEWDFYEWIFNSIENLNGLIEKVKNYK